MLATFLGLVIGLCVFLGATYVPVFFGVIVFPSLFFAGVFGVFLFLSLIFWPWISLFTRKEKSSPLAEASVSSCYCDKGITFLSGAVFFISLLGILLSLQNFFSTPCTFGAALVLIGACIDIMKYAFRRIEERGSPAGVADWLLVKFKKAARQGNENEVLECFELIFSLLIAYAKQGDISSMRLFSQRVTGLIGTLLRAISTLPLFIVTKDDTLLDRYGFAEAMTAKRLAWAMKVTGENGNPAALEETMRLYGKLFMVFHSFHDSLGNLLFVSLSQNLVSITKPEEHEKNAEYMMVCSEVIKSLIDRSNDKKVSEKSAIRRVLAVLETHVRECFRKDRSISPAFLMQPFAEVGQLLGSDRYTTLPDREEILMELRRILTQFAALETVSTRLEVGEPGADSSATYREDLPFHGPVGSQPERM